MQHVLNQVNYMKGKYSPLYGFLRFENNSLNFYRYKQFNITGRVHILYYIVIKIVEMFRKEKLRFSIPKDQISSIKIEYGEEYTGIRGSSFARMIGQSTKDMDRFVITTNDNEVYTFTLDATRMDRDTSEFNQLVAGMGMFLS